MTTERRSILERVAAGELTPDEAAHLLDDLHQPATTPPPPSAGAPPFEPLREGAGRPPEAARDELVPSRLERVRVVRNLGATRIVGDTGVHEAVAEGPHRAERLPRELVIHSDFDEAGGFNFNQMQGQWGRYRNARLNVRMRPDLPLEIQAQGASVQVQNVTGPISGDVQAGSLTIDGAPGPFDLSIQAGSLTIAGVIDRGTSKIRCEAGSVRVVLQPGSNVRVVSRSTMGHVSLPGQGSGRTDELVMGGGSREAIVGNGSALLEIESTMGSVRVSEG